MKTKQHHRGSQAEIFALYNKQMTIGEIVTATGYGYEYIDKLLFKWEMQKLKDTYGKKNEPTEEIQLPFSMVNVPCNNSFVLMTTNHEVVEAYNKMINGRNTIVQW